MSIYTVGGVVMHKPEANDMQIGGAHYGLCDLQHWDVVEQYGVGYLEGYATKYLVRYRERGGRESVQKALHCVKKLIEMVEHHGRCPRGHAPREMVEKMIGSRSLDTEARDSIHTLLGYWTLGDLQMVRVDLRRLLARMQLEDESELLRRQEELR